MPVTITLDDNLVAQLQVQAAARNLSVEVLALQILSEAIANEYDAAWRACNQRRIALIRKQFAEGLSTDEAGELQQLQDPVPIESPQITGSASDDDRVVQYAHSE
jgi:plasmid stability protein